MVALPGRLARTVDLLLRTDLLARGWTAAEIRRAIRAGSLTTIRPGSYGTDTTADPGNPEAQHVHLVRATLPHLQPGWVVSHQSAAAMHGLVVWNQSFDRVHVARDGSGGGRITVGVHRHVVPLAPDEIMLVDGIAVTSPARTVVDIAAATGFEQAVVVADAALAPRSRRRPPLTDRAALTVALTRQGRVGRTAARRVVNFADGGGRSPGESRSRVAMWRAGLPPPVLQYEVFDHNGRSLGFADFGWPELQTLGEFDGRVKYGRLVPQGQVPSDVLYAEKLREDAMRATALGMVRWTWRDIDPYDATAARLERTFAPGAVSSRTWPDLGR